MFSDTFRSFLFKFSQKTNPSYLSIVLFENKLTYIILFSLTCLHFHIAFLNFSILHSSFGARANVMLLKISFHNQHKLLWLLLLIQANITKQVLFNSRLFLVKLISWLLVLGNIFTLFFNNLVEKH